VCFACNFENDKKKQDTASRTARAAGGFYRMVAGTGADEIKYSPWLKKKGGEEDDEPEAAASGLTLGLGVGVHGKASVKIPNQQKTRAELTSR